MQMKSENTVSIIMPAYNAEQFISDAIDSVLAQTHQDWELLIVNDCSQDNTDKVVEAYCARDERIKFFSNEINSGPAKTRNNAINRAVGRFIAFLDSDDAWSPKKLELQLRVMIENGFVFTYTGYHRISEDGLVSGVPIPVPSTLNYSQLLKKTAIVTSSVVLDLAAIGKIQMKDTYYDDFACWLEIMSNGTLAHGVDDDLVAYRVATLSVSRNKVNSAIQVWSAYRDVEGLGLLKSVWCFIHYAVNALHKYKQF